MNIKINILNQNLKIPQEIVQAADGDELIAKIFYNRGYTSADTIRQMLHEEFYIPTETSEFPYMDEAIQRIVEAIESKQLIAVYGDYDVDGVTSTATLVQCLNFFTSSVIYHVPDRFTEGYGMNEEVIRGMAGRGVSLVITCDCGISNSNEIALAKDLGMDVIITDHHNIPDNLPPTEIILNPKLLAEGHRARNISGCAMAYFLCLALLQHYNQQEKSKEFLDLLALSLVADVVSLNGENRYLLKKALPRLFNTERVGLKELFAVIEQNSKLTNEEDIAFQIAPRINAAGRMDTAKLPVELFLCNISHYARSMAERIDILNRERKRVQQEIIEQAVDMVENRKKNKTVLVLFNEFWHHGIIGIAAGKICETYKKPAILLSMKEDGSTVVGSARSIDEINVYELIKECSSKLLKFGGHSAAAGLSLRREDLEAFAEEIERAAEKRYSISSTVTVDVDRELDVGGVNEELYERLCSAGPYGEGFEAPVFTARNVSVVSDRKTEKNHHIMVLAGENNIRIPAVKWFGGDTNLQGKVFDITYKIGRNTYRGNSQLQLTLDYIIESSGKMVKAFEGGFTDCRGKSIMNIISQYKGAVVFYEGLNSACPIEGTVDRYGLKQADNLLLLSTPTNTAIFRELVSLVNPQNIVLNFSVLPDYSFKGFVMNLMSTLKYIINNDDGRVQLETLASRLCVEETIIKAGLKYLRAAGKIKYSWNIDDNRVYIDISNNSPDRNIHMAEKNLKNALMEKSAYQQFLLKLEAERFKEYLK
ncbi:MAG: single-stranded-DNA-specific exonuclease RecJ [Clostridia bacterium]|nr:single-stranded-DNA-specific exonuclease RecJ [Clostridia bacterium]